MSNRKTMTRKVEEYVAWRRDLGYQLTSQGASLQKFAKYADGIKHRGPLTTELALRWVRLPASKGPLFWPRRLEIVRCFAQYLANFEPQTEVPPQGLLGSAHRRHTPHVFMDDEISTLIAAARSLRPTDRLRPRNYSTLIGLLACTGLRISEALRFTRSDFDAEQGVLQIRETKFRKSRLVPLHPSATEELVAYASDRDRLMPAAPTDRFFVSDRARPLSYSQVNTTFRQLCDGAGIVGRGYRPRPVLHDLRHTFACRRVERWYDSGEDVTHRIAALSTYLGHAAIHCTYWYLTATPELLEKVASRFQSGSDFDQQEGQP